MLDPLLCPHEEKKASSAALTWRGGRGALSAQSGAEVGGASEHAGHAPLPPPFRPAPHRALPCTVRRARPRARSAHTPEASGAAGGGGVPRRRGGVSSDPRRGPPQAAPASSGAPSAATPAARRSAAAPAAASSYLRVPAGPAHRIAAAPARARGPAGARWAPG